MPPQIEIRTPAITHSEEPPEIYVNVVLPTPTRATPMTPAMTPPIAPTSVPAIELIIPAATSTDSSVNSDRVGDPNLEPLW